MKIDAHQHFWQFNPERDTWIDEKTMSVIRRDFMPEHLAPILKKNNFDGCIAVQADSSETETRFLLELAEKNDFIRGVVGWIDLIAHSFLELQLDYYSRFPKLKGFRHILQSEKPEFMLDKKFIEGVNLLGKKNYTYDILVYPKHLKAVCQFLNIFSQKDNAPRFVIDHLAKPYIKKGLIRQWKKDMAAIAKHENVFCKISGMVTEADWLNWNEKDFTPYLDVVFETFGIESIMYGSDWPVCLVAGTYEKQLAVIENYILKFSEPEQKKIMGENAVRFYNI